MGLRVPFKGFGFGYGDEDICKPGRSESSMPTAWAGLCNTTSDAWGLEFIL